MTKEELRPIFKKAHDKIYKYWDDNFWDAEEEEMGQMELQSYLAGVFYELFLDLPKDEWLPFDPENVPEANPNQALLLFVENQVGVKLFYQSDQKYCNLGKWVDSEQNTLEEFIEVDLHDIWLHDIKYKLVRLPQVI